MKAFDELTDNEWALIQGVFETQPTPGARRGRPPVDARAVVNAVLWVLASGKSWNTLPGRYPSQPTCRRRFDKWQADGTLSEIVRRLGTGGREISLGDKHRPTAAEPLPESFNERLRGAFWTNPASWRTGPAERYRRSD